MLPWLAQWLSNRLGFTLIEVLMAIVVMSIGLLGLSALTIAMTTTLSFSKKLTTATTLAQEQMEAIRQTPYASINSGNFPPQGYSTIIGYPQFKREVTVSTDTPLLDTKTVMVQVSWQRQNDLSPYTVALKTIVNRP
jgi:prepilin-type N-terminal cleavage/methylation domain-containing protein